MRQSWKRIHWMMALAVLYWVTTMAVQAQTSSLIAFNQGDLWEWSPNGTTQRLTEWNYNGGPILSPDGRRVAYLSWSSETVEQFYRPGIPSTAENIWVYDLATADFDRIADQSANPGNMLRGVPSWSPDGTEIAWAEAETFPTRIGDLRLRIYNLTTRSTRTLSQSMSLGFQDGGQVFLPQVTWGTGGIARLVYTMVEGRDVMNILLELYDPNTGTKREFNIGDVGALSNQVRSLHWVNGQLALVNGEGEWFAVDLATGNRVPLAMQPVLANGSGTRLTPVPTTASGNLQWQWQVTTSDGTTSSLGYTSFNTGAFDVAIAPDGQRVAWVEGNMVNVWNAATRTSQPILTGSPQNYGAPPYPSVAWSVMEWTTDPALVVPIPPPDNVTGCLPPRLSLGAQTTLVPGEPNNVRTNASIHASRIGQLATGVVATVQEGPLCNGGFMWWRVSYQSGGVVTTGWTAESNGSVYWLQPYAGGSSAVCPGFLPSRLTIGMRAYVLPGLGGPNAIISEVGRGRQIIGNIPENAQFTVIGGPQCDFERNMLFWYVDYNGQSGWTAEGEQSIYWLAPVSTQGNQTTFCAGFLPSRLAIGSMAFVDDDAPNNIRATPESTTLLGQIPPGGTFSVIGGPVCGSRNDVLWWQINYNGTVGWTAEGQGNVYWLAPR